MILIFLIARNESEQSVYEFYGKASIDGGLSKPTLGSLVVIDPALDLGLTTEQAPGMLQNTQFQVAVSFENNKAEDIPNCEVLVHFQYDGTFVIDNAVAEFNKASFNSTTVVESALKQHGESRKRIVEESSGSNSLVNVTMLNTSKSEMSGSGVKSGGAYVESALSRIH